MAFFSVFWCSQFIRLVREASSHVACSWPCCSSQRLLTAAQHPRSPDRHGPESRSRQTNVQYLLRGNPIQSVLLSLSRLVAVALTLQPVPGACCLQPSQSLPPTSSNQTPYPPGSNLSSVQPRAIQARTPPKTADSLLASAISSRRRMKPHSSERSASNRRAGFDEASFLARRFHGFRRQRDERAGEAP